MPLRIDSRADDVDKHEHDINCLLFHDGKLYSGADDGTIKCWLPDLTKKSEIKANSCSVYSLAGDNNCIYSCSNEGSVDSYALDTLEKKSVLIQNSEVEYWRVRCVNGVLYSGDHEGFVKVWKNGTLYGSINICEPVKDMVIFKNLLITANMGIVVTDLKLEGEKIQFGVKDSLGGTFPLALIGGKYVAHVIREATDIVVNEISDSGHIKEITKTEGAHTKIINSLAGAKWNNKNIIFSGGWDKSIKKWIIENNSITLEATIDAGIIVNAIEVGRDGEIYAGGEDGHIVRIQVE
ncbi:unnamed protein product [Diabrotica balteata]|uniref:Myosin heavy chain kinase B n=1 Tax=Diabrotica balteata TaxID=107213 RepID=A0A9N9XI02_DIABA|nr:unnamed protein product [Diabrotica balteata]